MSDNVIKFWDGDPSISDGDLMCTCEPKPACSICGSHDLALISTYHRVNRVASIARVSSGSYIQAYPDAVISKIDKSVRCDGCMAEWSEARVIEDAEEWARSMDEQGGTCRAPERRGA